MQIDQQLYKALYSTFNAGSEEYFSTILLLKKMLSYVSRSDN